MCCIPLPLSLSPPDSTQLPDDADRYLPVPKREEREEVEAIGLRHRPPSGASPSHDLEEDETKQETQI